jgi:hypothetical protein
MYQNFFIVPYLYEAQRVSDDSTPIIRSLKLHWQPLVFHMWKVVGRVVGGLGQAQCTWQCPPTVRPTTFHIWKTRGCQCSFRLLMMGGESPETRASYKYGIIKILIHCCILLDFSLWSQYLNYTAVQAWHHATVHVPNLKYSSLLNFTNFQYLRSGIFNEMQEDELYMYTWLYRVFQKELYNFESV